jgi:hypothetical protein
MLPDILVIILSTGWENMELIHLTHDTDTSWALVNTAMALGGALNAVKYWNSSEIISVSRDLHHGVSY